ncbi:MAG: hypothetical protein JJT89_04520 [Nitriliruptoraceae bacterium]|nr:hypothetical protein [Nitriliruptoraceae bacterium]
MSDLEPPRRGDADRSGETTFDDQLEMLGFVNRSASRRGGRMWELHFNRFLRFVLHDYRDALVLSWSFALGEYLEQRGWRSSVTDTSVAELYPQHDVRLPLDIEAVGGEITRVLASLRLDLGDPTL